MARAITFRATPRVEHMKKVAVSAMLILVFGLVWAKSKEPAPEILGVRLGMDHSRAHARLSELGQFKSEDEGQEVWTLRSDNRYQYLIVGFDKDHNVRYVTAIARSGGQPVDYSAIGDLTRAEHRESAGTVRYIWKAKANPNGLEYWVIVRGQQQHRLAMYSVKRVGIKPEDEED